MYRRDENPRYAAFYAAAGLPHRTRRQLGRLPRRAIRRTTAAARGVGNCGRRRFRRRHQLERYDRGRTDDTARFSGRRDDRGTLGSRRSGRPTRSGARAAQHALLRGCPRNRRRQVGSGRGCVAAAGTHAPQSHDRRREVGRGADGCAAGEARTLAGPEESG